MHHQFHNEVVAVHAVVSVCLVYIKKAEDA